jgi:hypothetical protein
MSSVYFPHWADLKTESQRKIYLSGCFDHFYFSLKVNTNKTLQAELKSTQKPQYYIPLLNNGQMATLYEFMKKIGYQI